MIPTYEITNDNYTCDRGFVQIVKLTCECTSDDCHELIGTFVNGRKIIAIEMFIYRPKSINRR